MLMARIVDGRTDLVLDHLALGGLATDRDARGLSLIQWCAWYGDVSAIRILLTNGESLQSLGENLDLNGACFRGDWRLSQFLLEHGADVNHCLADTGETPLHATLSSSDNRLARNLVLRVLLSSGADPNRPTTPGVATASFLSDCRTRGETPLHRAAAFGDEEAIELLLGYDASVEVRDACGDSPLAWASWYLRPAHIVAKLCYGPHRVRPDYGVGLSASLLGNPRV